MNYTMVPHQRERQQHLTCKTADQSRRKAHKTVSLDKFVKIDAKKFHGDAQVISEVEMLSHLNDMVFLLQILDRIRRQHSGPRSHSRTHLRRLSRILISTKA
jgi:hypothetical protein